MKTIKISNLLLITLAVVITGLFVTKTFTIKKELKDYIQAIKENKKEVKLTPMEEFYYLDAEGEGAIILTDSSSVDYGYFSQENDFEKRFINDTLKIKMRHGSVYFNAKKIKGIILKQNVKLVFTAKNNDSLKIVVSGDALATLQFKNLHFVNLETSGKTSTTIMNSYVNKLNINALDRSKIVITSQVDTLTGFVDENAQVVSTGQTLNLAEIKGKFVSTTQY